jgi:hypothetical protein
MPGPIPKPESQRRRRNRPQTRRLTADRSTTGVPPLDADVLPSTREWWKKVWASPMAQEWLAADSPALVRLALMLDKVERGGSSSRLLAEIRALEDRFGLSPLARRRLQWELDEADAETKAASRDEEERWLRVVSD